jgi:hypothetical protein
MLVLEVAVSAKFLVQLLRGDVLAEVFVELELISSLEIPNTSVTFFTRECVFPPKDQ